MPKQYGPPLGTVSFTNDAWGEYKMTDDRTGQPVVMVSQTWLDGVLAGARYDATAAKCGRLHVDDGHTGKPWSDIAKEHARRASELDKQLAEKTTVADRRAEAVANLSHQNRVALGLDMDVRDKEIIELRRKLDLEVASHRANCVALNKESMRANTAEEKLREMSRSFMQLHDAAKEVVGPKRAPGMQSPANPVAENLPGRAQLAAEGSSDPWDFG